MNRQLIEEFGVSIKCERTETGQLVIDLKCLDSNPKVHINGRPLFTLMGSGYGGAGRCEQGIAGVGDGSTSVLWDGAAGAGGGCSAVDSGYGGSCGPTFTVPATVKAIEVSIPGFPDTKIEIDN